MQNNGVCDPACNNMQCLFDMGDCECSPGCDMKAISNCEPKCLNYACAYGLYGYQGGCTDYFYIALAQTVQALQQDFFTDVNWDVCHLGDFRCSPDLMRESWSQQKCVSTVYPVDQQSYIVCNVPSCLYSFGYCTRGVLHYSCIRGFGPGVNQCYQCKSGFVRAHSTCVVECPRRYKRDVLYKEICVPREDDSTEDSPDVIFAYNSENEGDGSYEHPFGNLHIALAAASRRFSVIYLLGAVIHIASNSFASSSNAEIVTLNSLDDPLGDSHCQLLRVESVMCSQNWTEVCSTHRTVIDITAPINLTIASRVEFRNVTFSSVSLFHNSPISYCPYLLTINGVQVDTNGTEATWPYIIAWSTCARFSDYSVFTVKAGGSLRIIVIPTQDSEVRQLTILPRAFITIQAGDVTLENVNFTGMQTQRDADIAAVVLQSQCDGDVCGSFRYFRGVVTQMNNVLPYIDPLRLGPFLYAKHLNVTEICDVVFSYNFVVQANSNTAVLSAYALMYWQDFYSLNISRCEFRRNFVTGGLIVVNSAIVLPKVTDMYQRLHISLSELTFDSNLCENAIIQVQFAADVLNVGLTRIRFNGNAVEGQCLVCLGSDAVATEALVTGEDRVVFDSSTGTKKRLWVEMRSVSLVDIEITASQSFESLIYVRNLANIRIANVTMSGNGDSEKGVIWTVYEGFISDYGVENSARPTFPAAKVCANFIWVDASAAISLSSVTIEENQCSEGMCGLKVTGYSRNVSVTDFHISNNGCNSGEGLGLAFFQEVNVTISDMTAVGNRNSLGGISVFGMGSRVEIKESLFERNQGVMGTGMNLQFIRQFKAYRCTFRKNISIDSIGGSLYFHIGSLHPAIFSIHDCDFSSNSATRGAVVAIESANVTSLHLTILSCEFTSNQATLYGAALFIGQFVSFEGGSLISDCIFDSHVSTYGVVYLSHNSGLIAITDCQFVRNSAEEAAVLLIETSPEAETLIENCVFLRNRIGPIILKSNSRTNSTFITRNCTFEGNDQANIVLEGGVWHDYWGRYSLSTQSTLRLSSGAISELQSSSIISSFSPSSGGGIHLMSSSSLTCVNCLFLNNTASYTGGAIFVEQESWIVLIDCEFRGNRASAGGSVLYFASTQTRVSRVESCVMEGNDGGTYGIVMAQTSVFTMENVTAIGNQGLECPGITLVMSHVSISNSLIASTSTLTAGFLAMFTSSSATINQSQFRDGSSKNGGYLNLFSLSNLTVSNSSFFHISTSQGGVISAHSSSAVQLTSVRMEDCYSEAAGSLLTMSESTLVVVRSVFRGYGVGGIVGTQLGSVEITDSVFQDGTGDRGAALYFYQCGEIAILRSEFTRQKAGSGGVMHFEALEMKWLGWVKLTQCWFEGNQADVGGVLYADNHKIAVEGGNFVKNTAKEAGAVYFGCSLLSICNYTLSNVMFLSNTAVSQGGSISWRSIQPSLSNLTFSRNSAVYGPDIASFPISLQVDSLQPKTGGRRGGQSLSTVSGVAPGQFVDTVITVSLRDHYGQVITSDNSSIAILSSSDLNSSVSGDTKVLAVRGVFTFSNFLVYAKPNSTVLIDISTSAISPVEGGSSLTLPFEIRDCIPGEFRSLESCSVCAPGTYSFDPDSLCQTCLANAVCLGNFTVVPIQGYWRAGIYESVVWECPNKEACVGGLSGGEMVSLMGQCSEGYQGNMCQSCADGYSSPSKNKCDKCLPQSTNIIRLVFVAFTILIAIIIIVWSALRSATRPAATQSILIRIFVNYLQLVLLVTDFKLRWPDIVLQLFESQEMVGGATQQAYSFDCFLANGSAGAELFYRKSLVMALLPIPLIGGAVLFWTAVAIRRRKANVLKRECVATIVILFFLILPNLIKSLFTLFSCTEIQSGCFWLTADMDIPCWDKRHTTYMLALGLPGIIVWVFGVPLWTLVLLTKYVKRHKETWLMMQYGFLINGYRHRTYYWEFVILYRKVTIICCSVFLNSLIPVQALTVQFVLLLAFFLQYNFKPYSTAYLNLMETCALLVADISIYCGLYYLTSQISVWVSWFFFILIVVANVLFLTYWLTGILGHLAAALSRQLSRTHLPDLEMEELIEACRKPTPEAVAVAGLSLMNCYRLGIGQTVNLQQFRSRKYRLYPVYANSSIDFTT